MVLGPISATAISWPMAVDFGVLTSGRWPAIGLATLIIVVVWSRRKPRTRLLQLASELLIVIPAYFAYFLVRGFVAGREVQAFRGSIEIINLERSLGFFWEPGLQERVLRFDVLVNLANWTYIWGHWPVIVFAALWLFLLHREAYPVYRNAFLISGAIGLIVFAAFPVAPPRFMDAWGFVDTIAQDSQAYWQFHPPAFVNQYAAMPSLHFGWNLLVGVAIVRHASSIPAKLVGLIMPAFMFLGIVLTGNHYIIDGIAGGALALLGLGLATLWEHSVRRGHAPGPAVRTAPSAS